MHVDEQEVGPYRIYAGALEAPGGYVAAAVVKRLKGEQGMPEVFRDEAMSGGRRWARPEDALTHAISKAKELILTQMGLAPC